MYKKIVLTYLTIIIVSIVCFLGSFVIVDPIGIFSTPLIKGINNNKIKQGGFLDVFKPYQVTSEEVKVVFIGTSRIYVGIKPILDKYLDSEVYNFGFSSLSLVNMEKYLDYLYCVQKPEKVYLGLDLFQFSNQGYKFSPKSFSETRLDKIKAINNVPIINEIKYLYALKENLDLENVLLPTYKASKQNGNFTQKFVRGWDVQRGASNIPNTKEYYSSLNSFMKTYDEYEQQGKSVKILSNIFEKAKQNNVELVVFFNPISVDLQVLMFLYGLDSELEHVKRSVTEIFGEVYDFNFVNRYTIDRKQYFYDASHYNCKFGELVKKNILANNDSEKMMVLTRENIDNKLGYEKQLKDKWIEENKQYILHLQNRVVNKERLEYGELKGFIGF